MIPFWCLMPKGEKLRPKQIDQLPLENFENSRVRIFDLSKILLLQNVTPRILQLNFFFSLLAKIRALPFLFLFPFAKP
jgi:hypothetical protein